MMNMLMGGIMKKKILIAVDDTKGSKNVLSVFHNFVQQPADVTVLHVERLQGRSLMIDMLGDAEMSTLKEMMKGTDYKAALDKRADRILAFYSKELLSQASFPLKTAKREGVPAEEILKAAEEEKADMIILGQSGRRGFDRFITGKVAKYVEKNAKVPVLVAKPPLMCEESYTKKDAWAAVSVTTAIMVALFLLGFILQKGSLIH
jgi:nucleotide-binding universal stress UspA family protein